MKKEPKNPFEKRLGDSFRPKKRANAKVEEKKAKATMPFPSGVPSFFVRVTASIITSTYCGYCGQDSHSSNNCPFYFSTQNSSSCGSCGQLGHSTGQCPYRLLGFSGILPVFCAYCGGTHNSKDCAMLANLQSLQYMQTMPVYYISLYPSLARDSSFSTEFGWRGWFWDEVSQKLLSPVFGVPWETAECRADLFNPEKDIRNKKGIHAYLVPQDWKNYTCETIQASMANHALSPLVKIEYAAGSSYPSYITSLAWVSVGAAAANKVVSWKEIKPVPVHGIVERFGQFQVGEIGWRSEWAVIRELLAPNQEIGLRLEQMFPEVKVHFSEESERPHKDFKDWEWKNDFKF